MACVWLQHIMPKNTAAQEERQTFKILLEGEINVSTHQVPALLYEPTGKMMEDRCSEGFGSRTKDPPAHSPATTTINQTRKPKTLITHS